MLINTIRKTASTRGVNFVQIDYWQQRISLFSSTRSEASFLATSCHSLGIWTDILVPAHTERRTSIHTSIGCSGQAVCSKLWESFKRNHASHEMSGRYPIHPDPFHLKKCLFFLQILKTSSNHIMYALQSLSYEPLNQFFLQKRLSVTPRSFMCYETSAIVSHSTSLPLKTFSQYTS